MTTELLSPPAATLDRALQEAFAQRMLEVLNSGALALMISIGHRTGLFDAMAELPPVTSAELARHTGLKERYVREWLGAMLTGGIVRRDAATGAYLLPPEHAAHLTRASTPENIATTAQWIAVLGGVEDEVLKCFRHGGGVPYRAYPRFHEVMAAESAQTVVAALIDQILPLAEGLTERLRAGARALDVGCGAGRAVTLLAACFPASRFAGYDLSEEAIDQARAAARRRGLGNLRFEVRDIAGLLETEAYDLITAFDVIHDQARPAEVLRAIRRALAPGGVFLMQDIDTSSDPGKNLEHPIGPFLYTISCMHCMTVSLAQAGAGLGACWGEELARRMLAEAGFARVDVHRLPHDFINCYYIARGK